MLNNAIPTYFVPLTIALLLLGTALGIFVVNKFAPYQRAKKNKKEVK